MEGRVKIMHTRVVNIVIRPKTLQKSANERVKVHVCTDKLGRQNKVFALCDIKEIVLPFKYPHAPPCSDNIDWKCPDDMRERLPSKGCKNGEAALFKLPKPISGLRWCHDFRDRCW